LGGRAMGIDVLLKREDGEVIAEEPSSWG
jgi:hypothetical protein